MLKRAIDIVISMIALVACTPLLVAAGILIKLDSTGPVFFRQVRVGCGGKPFQVYKLRTMVTNGGRDKIWTTPNDDPRITKVGRLLRRYNLDELPQLVNVLKGEMSIVGPRPEIPEYVAMFSEEEKEILSIRPGITDLATLWIRDKGKIVAGAEDPEQVYLERIRPQKLSLQMEYVRTRSIRGDFVIMFKTLKSHLLDPLLGRRSNLSISRREEGKDG